MPRELEENGWCQPKEGPFEDHEQTSDHQLPVYLPGLAL